MPKIPNPTNKSQEPGEKGVIKARKPRITKTTPKTFFKTFFAF